MLGNKVFAIVALVGAMAVALTATPISADYPPKSKDKVAICHKPGTKSEKTMEVPAAAVPGHLNHGDTLGACGSGPVETPTEVPAGLQDILLDSDGFATAGVGAAGDVDAVVGDKLERFADGCTYSLGVIDNDASGDWSKPDDLIVESAAFGTEANWQFYVAEDKAILDLDGSLKDGQEVHYWKGAALAQLQIKYRPNNDDGCWSPGGDIFLDANGNGLLDAYNSWAG